MVFAVQPDHSQGPAISHRIKVIAVKDLIAVDSVESFYVGMLGRLLMLDATEGNASGFGSSVRCIDDEFWTVVQTNRQRCTSNLDQLVPSPIDLRNRKAGVNVQAQRFPVELV